MSNELTKTPRAPRTAAERAAAAKGQKFYTYAQTPTGRVGGTMTPGQATKNVTKLPDLEWIRRQAENRDPAFKQFSQQYPDLARRMIWGEAYGWTPEQLQFQLQQSPEWKLGGGGGGRGGGGGGRENAKALAATINNRVRELGLGLTPEEVAKLAKNAVDNNWNEAQITDKMLISLDWTKVTGGDLTAGVDKIKALGATYLTSVSDKTARDWSARIASGEMTQSGIESMLQKQSKARYAWMGNLIDQGVKPADYFAPIRNVVAETLEVTPEQINLMDPKWMSMIEVRDPKTNELRAATLNEAMLTARKRPEWARTKQAGDLAANVGRSMAEAFGRVR